MKQVKEYSIKIIILASILCFYLFVCTYQNDDINLNDLSYFKSDCSKNCENSSDIMKCLDSCSGSKMNETNGSNTRYSILVAAIVLMICLAYNKEIISLIEHIKDRLGYKTKYSKIVIDDDVEDEIFHYQRITDI